MFNVLNNIKISHKLYGLIGIGLLIFAVAMMASALYGQSGREIERKSGLIGLDDTIVTLVKTYYELESSGALTREEAQAQAVNAVRGIRYNQDGYFWINDMKAVMIMHPTNPKLDGTDVSTIKDPDGRQIFTEFVKTVEANGKGFVEYKWPKPGFEEPVLKYSYVVGFEPWGWVIGTGVYVDDLTALFWQTATIILFGIVLIVLVTALTAFLVIRSIVKPLDNIKTAIGEIAAENTDVDVHGEKRKDEIGAIARAIAILRASVFERKALRSKQVEQQQALDDERSKAETERQRNAASMQAATDAQAHAIELLGSALEKLADGRLDNHISEEFSGDLDRVRQAFNRTVEQFSEIVMRLRQTSRGVKTATGEILSGANDLSERTTKQAATIEETSAAMEQLAHTVMDNAKKAGTASEQAKKASLTAEEGGRVMTQANEAMERISSSSSKISNIIGMIDDIAFQTNLLALNASVEAARAGEAGKGFAVVAIEVRRLAQSAAEASSEVKVLIDQSAQEVGSGTRLVAEAANKLASMLDAVRTNADQMQEIAKDSREQASSIEEVNIAIRQMDEMTQHNAALVEETNAAIEQTESQASELDRIVEVFTLADSGVARERPASRQPSAPQKSAVAAQRDARSAPKAAGVTRTYLSKGNAAVDADWNEF